MGWAVPDLPLQSTERRHSVCEGVQNTWTAQGLERASLGHFTVAWLDLVAGSFAVE